MGPSPAIKTALHIHSSEGMGSRANWNFDPPDDNATTIFAEKSFAEGVSRRACWDTKAWRMGDGGRLLGRKLSEQQWMGEASVYDGLYFHASLCSLELGEHTRKETSV